MDTTLQNRFTDPHYTNWLRLHRLLTQFHTFLLPFIQHQGRELWYDVIATWIKNQSRCTNCRASDITFNPRRVPRSKCWSITCPVGVCGRWVEEIARAHAYGHLGKIAFANCDVQLWPLEYWEFAKAFMFDMDGGRCKDDKGVGETSAAGASKSGIQRPEVNGNKPDTNFVQPKVASNETTTMKNKNTEQAHSSGGTKVSTNERKPVCQSNTAGIQTQSNENHNTGHVDKSSSNNKASTKSKSNRILVGGKVMIVGKRRQNTNSNKLTNKPELPDKPNQLNNKEPQIDSKEPNVCRPQSPPKTNSQPSQPPSKDNHYIKPVENIPNITNQQPEKLHSNPIKPDTQKAIYTPLLSKQANHDANHVPQSISNATDSRSNTTSAKPGQNNHNDDQCENPDDYPDGQIDLIHLLSFLVNCTALHTSARKSRDLEGGLSARHVVRIKKLMRLIEEIRNQILPHVDDQLFTQISSLVLEIQLTISKQFSGEFKESNAIHQVFEIDQCHFVTFTWRSMEVRTIAQHLQHIKKTLLSKQSNNTGVKGFMTWLHTKPNRNLLYSVQAVFDMDRFLAQLPPELQTELEKQLIKPSIATQTEKQYQITHSSTQTDVQPVSQPPFTSNTPTSFRAEPTSTVAKSSFDQIDLVHIDNEVEVDRIANRGPFDQPLQPSQPQLPDILMNGFVEDSASINRSTTEATNSATHQNNYIFVGSSAYSIDLGDVNIHREENQTEIGSTRESDNLVDFSSFPIDSFELESHPFQPLEFAKQANIEESSISKPKDHQGDSTSNNNVEKTPGSKPIKIEDTVSTSTYTTQFSGQSSVSEEHINIIEPSVFSNVARSTSADYIDPASDLATDRLMVDLVPSSDTISKMNLGSEISNQTVPEITDTRDVRDIMTLLRDMATETQTIETKTGYDLGEVEMTNTLTNGANHGHTAPEEKTSATYKEPIMLEKKTSALQMEQSVAEKKTSANDEEPRTAEITLNAKDEEPSTSETATCAKDKELCAPERKTTLKDDKPSASEMRASTDDKELSVPQNTPSTKDEEQSVSETTTSSKDKELSAPENIPSTKDEKPRAFKTTTSAKDEELNASEGTTSANDQKPKATEITLRAKDKEPIASQKTIIAKNKEPSASETMTSAKDEVITAPETTTGATDEEPSASETRRSAKDLELNALEKSANANDYKPSAPEQLASAKDEELNVPKKSKRVEEENPSKHQKTTSAKDNYMNPDLNPSCTNNQKQDVDEIKSSKYENRHALEEHSVLKTTKLSNASTQTLLLTWNAIDQEYLFTGSRGYKGTNDIECYDIRPDKGEGGCVVINNNGSVTVVYQGESEYKIVA